MAAIEKMSTIQIRIELKKLGVVNPPADRQEAIRLYAEMTGVGSEPREEKNDPAPVPSVPSVPEPEKAAKVEEVPEPEKDEDPESEPEEGENKPPENPVIKGVEIVEVGDKAEKKKTKSPSASPARREPKPEKEKPVECKAGSGKKLDAAMIIGRLAAREKYRFVQGSLIAEIVQDIIKEIEEV
jgi:outer membrane biosynthesis protein TonB